VSVTVIYVSSSIATLAAIVSITRCISRDDYYGAIKTFILSLIGIALIIGYPQAVEAVKEMMRG